MAAAQLDPTRTEGAGERPQMAAAALAVVLAIGLGQLADFATFLRMVSIGGFATEANPVVIGLTGTLGLATVLALKLALIPFVTLIVVVLARMHAGRLARSVLTIATVTGLFGALSNVLTVA